MPERVAAYAVLDGGRVARVPVAATTGSVKNR